jgi:HPt (histidine-containing phosphotransfer) domain-containing protein/two-component sensor histidine kinase
MHHETSPARSVVEAAPSKPGTFQMQIDQALGQRSIAGVLAYSVLLAILLGVTSARRTEPAAALALLVWMLAIGAVRLFLAVSFARVYARWPGRWGVVFRCATLLAGLSWGLACAAWTHIAGWGAESMIVLVTTAGVTAGGITSLNPSLRLVRLYVACMLVPTIVSMAFLRDGTHFELSFALVLSLYLGFLFVESRHLHRAFVLALERTQLLEVRAEALAERTRSVRLILESVGQGFLKVGLDGKVAEERSSVVDTWFGPGVAGERIWDTVARVSPTAGPRLRLGWEELAASYMPIEVILDQLPSRLTAGSRVLALEYRPVASDPLRDVLLIVSDVTAEIERERSERAQRELMAMFEHIQRDRAGVVEFLEEGSSLMSRLTEQPDAAPADVRRWIHTLKGNASLFGLTTFAHACHELEDLLRLSSEPISAAQRSGLLLQWQASAERMQHFLGNNAGAIEITPADYSSLRDVLAGTPASARALAILDGWQLESMDVRLARIAQQAMELAESLGKPLSVRTEPNGLRLDAKKWAPFWIALVHVLRNAIDHGVESAETRMERSKAPTTTLTLRTATREGSLVISVADDGAGIDWQRVTLRAAAQGLPHDTRAELEASLYADGMSTADQVSSTSGRGVGLGAFRSAVEAIGGRLQVTSELGFGTTWEAWFPQPSS